MGRGGEGAGAGWGVGGGARHQKPSNPSNRADRQRVKNPQDIDMDC